MSEARRVVLLGFMGSGKTTVGRLLAERLGWRFVDFDDVVEEEAGATIPELFRERGEQAFRALEEAVARRLLAEERVVLGSGGGWAASPGRLDEVPEGTVTVWLKVSPEEALRRVGRDPGRERPLLDSEAPAETASELLRTREPHYARAGWTVDTEGRLPVDVCERLVEIIRGPARAGSPPQ